MISLFSSEPLRRARSKRLWTELWAGIGRQRQEKKRDKDRKVKRELRAFDGSLGPEVKYEVLGIGKATTEGEGQALYRVPRRLCTSQRGKILYPHLCA
jgi:hypothetical protein